LAEARRHPLSAAAGRASRAILETTDPKAAPCTVVCPLWRCSFSSQRQGPLRAQGQPLGPEFRGNTLHPGALSPQGCIVVWQSDLQDGSSTGIYTQKFGFGGPVGGESRVNTTTTG